MDADELLSFLTLVEFDQEWNDLGFDDRDLARLQVRIMANPEAGAVIPQTNGVRKIRFARKGEGKSGGVRVCYAHFPIVGIVLLATVYAKNEKANVDAEARKRMHEIVARFQRRIKGAQ
jgi:hypothetical protein